MMLTPDQEEMLSFLTLRDECRKARKEWSIHMVGGQYVVQVASQDGNVQRRGNTFREAAMAALRANGLIGDAL